MKISLKVQPKSSREEVIKDGDANLKVYIKQAPVDGKANKAMIRVLAGYYKVRKASIRIVTGGSCRNKIVEIEN